MPDPVEDDWYIAVTGSELQQGELLFDLPVPVASAGVVQGDDGLPTVEATIETVDVIVLTQTCDLLQSRVAEVLLCQVVSWEQVVRTEYPRNQAVAGSAFRDKLIEGGIPSLSLLHRRVEPPSLPWSLANFRRLYTVSRDYLDGVVQTRAEVERLRLLPPYREHLAQAFARYFMRVGLPHVASAFKSEGADIVKAVRAELE